MKVQTKTLAACGSILAFSLSSYASVTTTALAVGSATDFPTTSISAANGNRSFSDILASPAGATIAGAQAQGGFATGVAWGEVFNWTGSANGNVFSAFSMIVNGGSATATYQPVLLDLGTTIINSYATTFNPSLHPNLLGSISLTLPAIAARSFVEFDLNGSDSITLTVGNSYAFGLLNVTAAAGDINFLRDSGVQADPNGAPWQTDANGLSSTSGTVPGWGGGPRNLLFGIYTTTAVPEPSSFALAGVAVAAMLAFHRRKY